MEKVKTFSKMKLFADNFVNKIEEDYKRQNGTSIMNEAIKNILHESYQSGWINSKYILMKEFEEWFCNGYCRFYKDENYCKNCPIKLGEEWLK